jgi:hypothetical protein
MVSGTFDIGAYGLSEAVKGPFLSTKQTSSSILHEFSGLYLLYL